MGNNKRRPAPVPVRCLDGDDDSPPPVLVDLGRAVWMTDSHSVANAAKEKRRSAQ